MNKKIKLPKPIRNIKGYLLRPINQGVEWGMYAGKKLKFKSKLIQDCEAWAELAYETATKERELKDIEKYNKMVKPTKRIYTGNLEKQVNKRKGKLTNTKTPK